MNDREQTHADSATYAIRTERYIAEKKRKRFDHKSRFSFPLFASAVARIYGRAKTAGVYLFKSKITVGRIFPEIRCGCDLISVDLLPKLYHDLQQEATNP